MYCTNVNDIDTLRPYDPVIRNDFQATSGARCDLESLVILPVPGYLLFGWFPGGRRLGIPEEFCGFRHGRIGQAEGASGFRQPFSFFHDEIKFRAKNAVFQLKIFG